MPFTKRKPQPRFLRFNEHHDSSGKFSSGDGGRERLKADLSTLDLSTWQERVAAQQSGEAWYRRLENFARNEASPPPPGTVFVRATGQPVEEGQSLDLPMSNWTTAGSGMLDTYVGEDSTVLRLSGGALMSRASSAYGFDVHELGADDPMDNWFIGGRFTVGPITEQEGQQRVAWLTADSALRFNENHDEQGKFSSGTGTLDNRVGAVKWADKRYPPETRLSRTQAGVAFRTVSPEDYDRFKASGVVSSTFMGMGHNAPGLYVTSAPSQLVEYGSPRDVVLALHVETEEIQGSPGEGIFRLDDLPADRILGTYGATKRSLRYNHNHGEGGKFSSGDDSSTQAAERRIDKVLPNAEVYLHGMDPELASHVADRIEDFASKYPGAAGWLQTVTMGRSDDAVAWEQDNDHSLTFNTEYWQPHESLGDGPAWTNAGSVDLQTTLTEAYHDGAHPYDDIDSVINHELGHVLDAHLHDAGEVPPSERLMQAYDLGGLDGARSYLGGSGPGELGSNDAYAIAGGPAEAWGELFAMHEAGRDDELTPLGRELIGTALSAEHEARSAMWTRPTPASRTCRGYLMPRTAVRFNEHHDASGKFSSGDGAKEFVGDLNAQLSGDKPWDQSFMPPMPSNFEERLGQCYVLSAQEEINFQDPASDDRQLVHGTIQGDGEEPINHAWNINPDGSIHEPASNRDYTPKSFERLFNPTVDRVYSHDEAVKMMLSTEHYGPWSKAEEKEALRSKWGDPRDMEEFVLRYNHNHGGGGRFTSNDEASDEIASLYSPRELAEIRLRDAFPNATVNLHDVDEKLGTEVADRAKVFSDEFPHAAATVGRVQTYSDAESDTYAKVSQSYPRGPGGYQDNVEQTIWLNTRYYGNASKLEEAADDDAMTGWHPVGGAASIIDHELGHVFDYAEQRPSMETVWKSNAADNISVYAERNAREAFAEAFTLRQAEGIGAVNEVSPELGGYLARAIDVAGGDQNRSAPLPDAEETTCEGYISPAAMEIWAKRSLRYNQNHDEHGKFAVGDGAAFDRADWAKYASDSGDHVDDAAALANQRYGEWAKSLTTDETEAVLDYQTILVYDRLNESFRNGTQLPDDLKAIPSELDSAIDKGELSQVVVVYRGLDASGTELADVKPGDTFVDHGYVSTSLTSPVAELFASSGLQEPNSSPALMEIRVPAGQRAAAADVVAEQRAGWQFDPWSDDGPMMGDQVHTNEMVLPRDTAFHIDAVQHEQGMTRVFATASTPRH